VRSYPALPIGFLADSRGQRYREKRHVGAIIACGCQWNKIPHLHIKLSLDGILDRTHVGVAEGNLNGVFTVLAKIETKLASDSAHVVLTGELARVDGVEGAQDVQLATVNGGRVAKSEDFGLHDGSNEKEISHGRVPWQARSGCFAVRPSASSSG
jgi:hypothetical protein